MFPRRRRPILGAAVLVGASSVAAKREVQRQGMMSAQREMEIQYQVDARRREEEEQERRTQRAVEEALKKSAAENQAAQQQQAAVVSPPPQQQQLYNNPMPIQTQDSGYLAATPGQPAYMMAAASAPLPPSPQPPAYYLSASPSQEARPKSAQGLPAQDSKTRYCTQCGYACQAGDRFCSGCGAKQAPQESLLM
ncbi:hypothetical protein FP744_10009562 [Trichoderma asperellum]|nr:hypothetical protein LI328DRAFT_146876 [Trichoderma asperelloides]